MKVVPDVVGRVIGRNILKIQKNSPRTLFVIGLGSAVTATVLACKATLKLEQTMLTIEGNRKGVEELKISRGLDYTDDDYRKDVAHVYLRGGLELTKLYGPALMVGTVAVASLVGSHHILTNRNVALTAAYASLMKAHEDYRRRVINKVGLEKEDEIYRDSVPCEIEVDGKKVKGVKAGPGGGSPYARFFDESSTQWRRGPDYNKTFLLGQQSYLNDLLHHRGHVFLNEVYDRLGLERTPAGQIVGWVLANGDDYIDFGLERQEARRFFNGLDNSVLLDFNVDGGIHELIGRQK